MKKAIFVVGPTAVGKTSIAGRISKKIPSILISADSVQVYRGCDIISGKDHTSGTKILLVDIVSPFETFSVSNFIERIRPIIIKTLNQGMIPITVGGTGFYADAFFTRIDTLDIPQNLKLRKQLDVLSIEELQKKLKEANFIRFKKMNESDIKNKRRLIRAIEVQNTEKKYAPKPLFNEREILFVGLRSSMENIKKRIIDRVEKRLKEGALVEAKRLFSDFAKLSSQIKAANGYRQLFGMFKGELSFEEAKKKWIIAEGQLAKKQMTWFQRNPNINWFDIEKKGFENKIFKLINENFPS